MKNFQRIIGTIAAFSITFLGYGQVEKAVQSSVSKVTVFINQAQVTREFKTDLQDGATNIVVEKVSPFINANSIEVKVDPGVTILSVSQRTNYLVNEEKPVEIVQLEDSIQAVTYLLEELKGRKEAFQTEKEVLLANKKLGGENTGLKVEDFEDALQIFRKYMLDINRDLMKISQDERKLQLIKSKLDKQLREYNAGNKVAMTSIIVSVSTAGAKQNAKLEVSYIVSRVSWRPVFDIRVKDTKSPVQLYTKAAITQNTQEDWKDVQMKLTTANPLENGRKPELSPLYLRFYQPNINLKQNYKQKRGGEPMALSRMEESDAGMMADEVVMAQTDINTEYILPKPYTIPSDNAPHQVDLIVVSLDAVFAYSVVPKLDKNAFVTAKVPATDIINQISGEANVYFDGTFTGKTQLNSTANDSLLISLGRDKRIQVERKRLKDFSSKATFGNSRKEISGYEINIKNTRKETILVRVEDQIPVSTDKEIEVKIIDYTNATYDESTGKLYWLISIPAEQSKSLKFSFEVKYPGDKKINPY